MKFTKVVALAIKNENLAFYANESKNTYMFLNGILNEFDRNMMEYRLMDFNMLAKTNFEFFILDKKLNHFQSRTSAPVYNHQVDDYVSIGSDIEESDDYDYLRRLKGLQLRVTERHPKGINNEQGYTLSYLAHGKVRGYDEKPFLFKDIDLKEFK